jgi:tRNA pseudouridine55 synthase
VSELVGMVVVDKEPGWTSHDVVARCRRIFGQRRVGHAGTLDPDATGLLLVGLGRATRLLRFLTQLPKSYVGEIVLGATTTTLDSSGSVTDRWDMSSVTLDDARLAAQALTGPIQQIPPMVSAVKVGGQRLHRLAREGIEVERMPRAVEVHRFDLTEGPEPGVLRAEVDCSSGTYVRVLAADLGSALGGGAFLQNLRRTSVGPFTEADAHQMDSIDLKFVLPPAQAIQHLTSVTVDTEVATVIGRGLPLDRVSVGASGPGPWALVDGVGDLLAVYEATETDRILPAVVLANY